MVVVVYKEKWVLTTFRIAKATTFSDLLKASAEFWGEEHKKFEILNESEEFVVADDCIGDYL